MLSVHRERVNENKIEVKRDVLDKFSSNPRKLVLDWNNHFINRFEIHAITSSFDKSTHKSRPQFKINIIFGKPTPFVD